MDSIISSFRGLFRRLVTAWRLVVTVDVVMLLLAALAAVLHGIPRSGEDLATDRWLWANDPADFDLFIFPLAKLDLRLSKGLILVSIFKS